MMAEPDSAENRRSGLGPFVGADGFAMLGLSCLVILACGGLSFVAAALYVLRAGWCAPTDASGVSRIVVLGYRLPPGGRPNRIYRDRLARSLALRQGLPYASVFLLGGRARAGAASEAEAGAAWLQERGVPARCLSCEDRSRHTLENLRLYRDAFPPGPDETAALVTSRFHLARAGLMAAGMGLRCRPCAAEATPGAVLLRPFRMLTEAFLVHWYVVGFRFSKMIGNAHMLGRIR